MLEQALKEERKQSPNTKKGSKMRPGSQNFLKKKGRYDPLKQSQKGLGLSKKRI